MTVRSLGAGPRTLPVMPASQQAALDPYMALIIGYRKSGLSEPEPHHRLPAGVRSLGNSTVGRTVVGFARMVLSAPLREVGPQAGRQMLT
jgi:hypothetical protein